MDLNALLKLTVDRGASDLHLTAHIPPTIRLYGTLIHVEGQESLTPKVLEETAFSIITPEQKEQFLVNRELDFAIAPNNVDRFRVNIFWQKDSIGLVFRAIPTIIPTPEEIGLTEAVVNLTNLKNGLVLVTGPTGSGKSTTLASMINKINLETNKHILTIEDPIEFSYKHAKSIVNQRQVGTDTKTFASALKSALREDPDVILVGEMRDLETISATLTIAETGHLAFATLHTVDVAQTVDRIIDVFPPHQQQQIRMMLSVVLRGIICQQLLPSADGKGRVAAREILIADHATSNLIREGNTPQIYSRLQTGGKLGMCTLDASLQKLLKEGKITQETADAHTVHKGSSF